ncbi:MAG TPA: replication-associated recombination protein A [Dehalococcoidia bacterium]|nr:replication-associated recombination protein A [Dehalococcoidia bacterium]
MRPRSLDDYVGQEHIIGPGKLLRRLVESGMLPSIILWGPPGSGKTTLARIIASQSHAHFVALSAVSAGVADLRRVVAEARERSTATAHREPPHPVPGQHSEIRGHAGQRTILFIDEIHRFNKAQQDAVLPYVEDGTITLIGATTENPSFEVIGPLLSRARVFTLKALDEAQLTELIRRAIADPDRGLGGLNVKLTDDAVDGLAASVGGDARIALNALEAAAMSVAPASDELAGAEIPVRLISREVIEEALQHRTYLYDRQGDAHYDTVSAFIKSLRGSDPDAALYWLARMVEAGEDPLFIVRRMVILASEDVGLADPQALSVATACQQAVHFVGMPEGFFALAETALYLALAPKSNSVGAAYARALADVERTRNDPVPMHLRNAVTGLMRGLGYGKGYQYAHDYEGGVAPEQTYLPERLAGHRYYVPRNLGAEPELGKRGPKRETGGTGGGAP